MSKTATYLSWAGQIVAGAILLIAMAPKLLGAPESIELFRELGAEPWGRYIVGVVELVAAALLLVPGTGKHAIGALIAAGAMVGALGSHAWRLGFSGDTGAMAGMATLVLAASLLVLYLRRGELTGPRNA